MLRGRSCRGEKPSVEHDGARGDARNVVLLPGGMLGVLPGQSPRRERAARAT